MEPKNQYIKQGDRAQNFIPFDSSQRASHFSVFVCQNLMKNGRAFFGFWAQIFFGGLNQKSAMISMCKILIYIDSESFRQIR